MKLGGEYARLSTYHYLLEESDNTWCFFLSPEVGCTIFPSEELHLGGIWHYITATPPIRAVC